MNGLLGYAFTLGLVAAVNPCGFALLPVYLPSFARVDDRAAPPARRLARAVWAAVLVSAGFGLVFGAVGAAVSAGAGAVMRWAPWAMVALAALMVAAGVWSLAGRPAGGWLARLAPHVHGRSPRSMFVFGVGYGLASLSCALPVFLAGVAGAFLRSGLPEALAIVLAYAAGMATVFTALAVAVAFGWRAPARGLRRLSRYVEPLGGVLLIAVGGYLAYYWVTSLVAPVTAFPLTGLVESFQARVAGQLSGAGPWVGAGVAGALLLAAVAGWLSRRVGARAAAAVTLALPALLVPAVLLHAGVLGAPAHTSAAARTAPSSAPAPRLSRSAQYLTTYTPQRPPTPAPGFALTGQHGRRVSLASLRGKIVVLSFMDDHCHDICLLYAPDMLAAARDLGSLARQVEFVGINVNPFHTRPAAVAGFTRREHLSRLPHWHFLTGTPSALRKVWHSYGETVEVRGHSVQHEGVIYFLGRRGREQAEMNFGDSAAHTARWGHALADVAAGLLGKPAPRAAQPSAPARSRGPGIDVAGHGRAPAFRLPRLRQPARDVSLAGLAGKPLVVSFWASWCTPCLHELPVFRKAASRWRGRVTFVGITIDDQRASALRVARQAGLAYPLAYDRAGKAAAAYQVVDLPTTFFISAGGRVVARHTGEITGADLARAVRSLSRGQSPG